MSKDVLNGVFAVVALLMMCLALDCTKLDNDARYPSNSPPVIYMTNVPVEDSEWWQSPVVGWYATDEDGFVTKYRHVVKKCDNVENPNLFIESSEENGYLEWVESVVDRDMSFVSGTIRLYGTSGCDSCLVCNYLFVQAEDDLGEKSAVVHRRFFRGNHSPETHVQIDSGPHFVGTCCEIASMGSGVRVEWYGTDTIDYPRSEPYLDYSWEVYGPFEGWTDLSGCHPDTLDVNWESFLVDSSWNDETNSRWTDNKSTVLSDLFRSTSEADTTKTGYFVFMVRARDDAYVADPTPALTCFMAMQPACEKNIMLVDMTRYGLPGPGSLYGETGNASGVVDSLYHPYFRSIVEEAFGESIDGFYYACGEDNLWSPPGPDLYARFKLMIIIAEDLWYPTPQKWLDFMAAYMDIGGKVMLMGVDPLASTDSPEVPPHMEYFSTNSIAHKYFNVQGQFLANWIRSWRIGEPNEEFIGTLPMDPFLPEIHTDSVQLTFYIAPKHNIWRNEPPYPYHENAIPGVNYFVTAGSAGTVYMARSAYGTQGMIDGGICGLRYETECFKSAVFGFPLWPLNRDDAVGLMRGMIDWYDIK